MFTRIETLNYRCLRYVSQSLGPFHVLVGPNASGKTTFLDTIAFLGDVVSEGLDKACFSRATTFEELTWRGRGQGLQLSVEVRVPDHLRLKLPNNKFDTFRYETSIGVPAHGEPPQLLAETGLLLDSRGVSRRRRESTLFPDSPVVPESLLHPLRKAGRKCVFSKRPGQSDNYYPETATRNGSGKWMPAFKLGPHRSTLANLPEDEDRFPVATWFKQLLGQAVQRLTLDSQAMRRPSPPRLGKRFQPDGTNLPWVIESLRSQSPERFSLWLEHVRTALDDVEDILTIERPEDRHRYLVVLYRGGIRVPSWLLSDGTLRLLALTLLAYIPDFSGIYLIEEPENGIHPRAIETVFESLSSAYDAQVLLATHSPVILSRADPDRVLCFAKTSEGATDIVSGDRHPRLRNWRREENLGVLFAAGVLG